MCKINCSGGCINCVPEEHIEDLQNQLATAQATIERLRGRMLSIVLFCRIWGGEAERARKMLEEALVLPNDTTALNARLMQAKVEVLKEAANKLDPTEVVSGSYSAWLRRMADEIEKKMK